MDKWFGREISQTSFKCDKICQEQLQQSFGEKTALFFQQGKFYEFWEFDESISPTGKHRGILTQLSNILSINIGVRGDSPSKDNPYFGGFPIQSKERNSNILLNQGWTVVIVNQIEDEKPQHGEMRRVVEILSPAMNPQSTDLEQNMVILFIEQLELQNTIGYQSMMVSFDINTGKMRFHAAYPQQNNPFVGLQESFSFCHTQNPRQVLMYFNDSSNASSNENQKPQWLSQVKKYLQILPSWNFQVEKVPESLNNQQKSLRYLKTLYSSFSSEGKLNDFLNQHNLYMQQSMMISLALAFNVIESRNPQLLKGMQFPEKWLQGIHLTLSHDALHQLNVFSMRDTQPSLVSLYNYCNTPMGKREFRSRLWQPSTKREYMQRQWDAIEYFSNKDMTLLKDYRIYLGQIGDMEKYSKKMKMNDITPRDFCRFIQSWSFYKKISEIGDNFKLNDTIQKTIQEWCQEQVQNFNLSQMTQLNSLKDIQFNIFRKNKNVQQAYEQFQNINEQINQVIYWMQQTINDINGKERPNVISWDCTPSEGYFIQTTKKRWNDMVIRHKGKFKINNMLTLKEEDFITRQAGTGNKYKIRGKWVDEMAEKYVNAKKTFEELQIQQFSEHIDQIIKNQQLMQDFDDFIRYISQLDIWISNAYLVKKHKWSKPTIQDEYGIQAEQIRHPIIEYLQDDMEYIPNDIDLTETNGNLLYGINASGKSSTMKSLGIALICAQAGLYVPAKFFKFRPFNSLFTRVSSGDNIFQGLSTFAVEMQELRNIIQHSNENTLVLGDEICAGTETHSAHAIVAAGIIELCKLGSRFMFATHLHSLQDLDQIKQLHEEKKIKSYHLKVDQKDGQLIYIRQMEEGAGPSTYGILVCQAMGFPQNFVESAESLRLQLKGKQMQKDAKVGRYGSQILLGKCQVCKKEEASEIHHIKEQHTSNEEKYIGIYHKDRISNQVPICTKCHIEHHHGNIDILGWITTSNGRQLNVIKKQKTKLDNTSIRQNIIDLAQKGFNPSQIRRQLLIENEKVPSLTTIRKYLQ